MKRFALTVLMILFAANVVASSAWAGGCSMAMDTASAPKQAQNEMPCHEKMPEQAPQKSEHCEGVCLCLHLSVNQVPILNESHSFAVSFSDFQARFFEDEEPASLPSSPLFKPPIA